jgi:hypothetical protein
MNVVIKSIDLTNVIGTSYYNDSINASVNELIKILGVEPIKDFGDRIKFQWTLEYHSEMLNKRFSFTIYDYNEDWEQHIGNSTGVNDYLYTTRIDWHIGGKTADDTMLVKVWLNNKLKKLRNEG